MRKSNLKVAALKRGNVSVPLRWSHTLVVGSGAAGLNAAVQLRANGIRDILIVSEGLKLGTSINTGSDKQTYYKLAMCGADADAPAIMAETYFAGGSMNGDLALVEAAMSARAFINLVNLGVPFPRDAYGQFVGYKTDHDPRQRATSIGPYTSREMCRALIREVKRLDIPVLENRNIVKLLTVNEDGEKRAAGVIALNQDGKPEAYCAANVVFAVGGPGGLYAKSVYPDVHTGAIGIALMAGAAARNLPESQYGMASVKFRWNVSGTYMQVIPRFISTAADGKTDEREFLGEYFDSAGAMNSAVFLKGYQWPFDSRKTIGGSSLIDILVYEESVTKGRRVFLDFRRNPDGFRFEDLSKEALEYLTKSGALQTRPVERLRTMNPGSIDLYKANGIDIAREPLEIGVCAQHNNGGLAANKWWESVNIRHLFPVGEVNGSHGVYRPGGSALNSGQVGAFRAAEFIANRYTKSDINRRAAEAAAARGAEEIIKWLGKCRNTGPTDWKMERREFQERMTANGAHIRDIGQIRTAIAEAWQQVERIERDGCAFRGATGRQEAAKNRQLCFAHAVYLEAILFALESGVGSRGSSIALTSDGAGLKIHDKLPNRWRIAPENESFRNKTLETRFSAGGKVVNSWMDRLPIPESDTWFETAWAKFRSGEVYL